MAIVLTTTKKATGFVKALVFGEAGMGKTVLCATAPNPIIISAEAGLLSIADHDIPVIEVKTVQDVMDAYQWVTEDPAAKQFETICLDSITEIAEVLLTQYKREEKDPRKAYGRINDDMSELIRKFRDLKGKHVYFSCKMSRKEDGDSGIVSYKPAMPGNTLINNLPYFFDEVLALRIGKLPSGKEFRYLQTQPELQWPAKDRSGCLEKMEKPDLSYIFDKIAQGKKKLKEEVKENEETLEEEKLEEDLKASPEKEASGLNLTEKPKETAPEGLTLGEAADKGVKKALGQEPKKEEGLTLGTNAKVPEEKAETESA